MIEVLFGDSEAASMKTAKNTVVIGEVNGPTSVWTAGIFCYGKRSPANQSKRQGSLATFWAVTN